VSGANARPFASPRPDRITAERLAMIHLSPMIDGRVQVRLTRVGIAALVGCEDQPAHEPHRLPSRERRLERRGNARSGPPDLPASNLTALRATWRPPGRSTSLHPTRFSSPGPDGPHVAGTGRVGLKPSIGRRSPAASRSGSRTTTRPRPATSQPRSANSCRCRFSDSREVPTISASCCWESPCRPTDRWPSADRTGRPAHAGPWPAGPLAD